MTDPSGLSAIGISASETVLSWINGTGYNSLSIERSPAGASSWVEIANQGGDTFRDSTCADGTPYDYRIRGYNLYTGLYTDYSNTATGTTKLPAPAAPYVNINTGGTTGALYFADQAQNESGFKIYMTAEGGATFSLLDTVATPNLDHYDLSGLTVAQWYGIYVTAYNGTTESAPSTIVNFFTADPPNAPSLLALTALGSSSIRASWRDNSDNETGFTVEWGTDGITFGTTASIGANVATYDITGLASNTLYYVRVKATNASGSSAYCATANVSTMAAIAQPTGLTVTPWGSGTLEIHFQDNSTEEDDHRLERRPKDGSGYSADLTGGKTFLADSEYSGSHVAGNAFDNDSGTAWASADTAMPHWVRVDFGAGVTKRIGKVTIYPAAFGDGARAKDFTVDGSANGSSWTNIYTGQCTDSSAVQAFTFTNILSFRYWRIQVTSSWCTGSPQIAHILEAEMMEYLDFLEMVTLEPNRTFYRNTGLDAGTAYDYRLRAKQGGSYSAYSATVYGTTLSLPSTPSSSACSEYQDTSAVLTWADPAGAEFIHIEKAIGAGAYAEIAVVIVGAQRYKVTGLTAGTLYHFKIRAHNAVGYSASYDTAVDVTTRAAYLPSRWERYSRRKDAPVRLYAEGYLGKALTGWTLTGGKTYTYEKAISDKNGVALSIQSSIVTVEAAAGSFWHDTAARKVYVHTSTGIDPVNFAYVGRFWFYASQWSKVGDMAEFNGHDYPPLIAADGIPDVTVSIDPIWQGSFQLSVGSLLFINGYRKGWGGYVFDIRCADWIWEGSRWRILAGGPGFTYSELKPVVSAYCTGKRWARQTFEVALGDPRAARTLTLPQALYSVTDFPLMDSGLADQAQPFGYGAIAGAVPKLIDATNRVYEYNNGRAKGVTAVYQNAGAALTAGTDYFDDPQHGRFTLARGLTWATSDKMTCSFSGHVDDEDTLIENGGLVFLDLMTRYVGMGLSELDLDSIYATAAALTSDVSLYVYKGGQDAQEIVRILEASCLAWSVQDEEARVGFKRKGTAAASGCVHFREAQITDLSQASDLSRYASELVVNYAEDQSDSGRMLFARRERPEATWERGVQSTVTVTAALESAADAEALADAILDELGRLPITLVTTRLGWRIQPGDVFLLTFPRFPSTSGEAASLTLRALSVGRGLGRGETTLTAEEV
jgi:hypothetical protein